MKLAEASALGDNPLEIQKLILLVDPKEVEVDSTIERCVLGSYAGSKNWTASLEVCRYRMVYWQDVPSLKRCIADQDSR